MRVVPESKEWRASALKPECHKGRQHWELCALKEIRTGIWTTGCIQASYSRLWIAVNQPSGLVQSVFSQKQKKFHWMWELSLQEGV